jgi:hypothetical protein
MIDQTEELLRAGMDRFTAGTNVPAGLAVKAARHRQRTRRTRTAAAIGVASAAAVTAVAVAVPGSAPHAQTAAYVVSRVQDALSQASSQNAIQHVRETTTLRVYLAGTDISGQTAGSWSYRGQSRNEVYASDGRIAAVLSRVPGGQVPKGQLVTDTLVNYQEKTWWRDRHAVNAPPKATPTPHTACQAAMVVEGGGAWVSNVAAELRTALSCGQYTTAGYQRVDGVRALELKPVKAGPLTAVFWVDPATYLPVRDLVTAGRATIRDDFTWLPPTPANLATLDVRVPPGFTRIPPQD